MRPFPLNLHNKSHVNSFWKFTWKTGGVYNEQNNIK